MLVENEEAVSTCIFATPIEDYGRFGFRYHTALQVFQNMCICRVHPTRLNQLRQPLGSILPNNDAELTFLCSQLRRVGHSVGLFTWQYRSFAD